jgi:hypothetical protein
MLVGSSAPVGLRLCLWIMDAIPVTLSKIVKDEGWFMSQCVQSLKCVMVLRGPLVQGLQPTSPTPVTFIWVFAALPQCPLSHFQGALAVVADIVGLYRLRISTYKWCQLSTKFLICILKTLLDQFIILLLPLPLFYSISGVAEVVDKLILWSGPLHVRTVCYKVLWFALCNKSLLVFLFQVFVCIEGVDLAPQTLNKPALVGPPSMSDDLHRYLLPLLL